MSDKVSTHITGVLLYVYLYYRYTYIYNSM